jgi:hypothetical protein
MAKRTLYCEYNVPITSRHVSQLFGKCPRDARRAIKEEKAVQLQRSQLTELANSDFESAAKESFEIATKITYRNGARIGIPKAGAMVCARVATAPMLPTG